MRQNRVHLMPPMSNFYARICVKATPSSNSYRRQVFLLADFRQGIRRLRFEVTAFRKQAIDDFDEMVSHGHNGSAGTFPLLKSLE